jgi:flagellar biosynthesis protein FlhA
LKPSEYRLLLKGNVVGKGDLMLGHYLALSPGETPTEVHGIPTKDPTFGLPAIWIPDREQESVMRDGYTVIDHSTVVATHLTELFKKYADELLSRQTTQRLLDNLAESQPKLVEELVPGVLSVGGVQKVFQNLIRERVSIRDIQTVCETLADYGPVLKDHEILTEYVRQALARTITKPYESMDGKLHLITIQQDLEDRMAKSLQKTEQGTFLAVDPEFLRQFIQSANVEIKKVINLGMHPVILCSPLIRRHLRKLLERFLPEVVVLSHNELSGHLEIKSVGMIRFKHAG